MEIKCVFKTGGWLVIGTAYYCEAHNTGKLILDRVNRNIQAITGTHTSPNTNANVKIIWILNSKVFYFPFGLQDICPNIEGIAIQGSKLRELRKEDLKQFTNLREIDLYDNEIEYLEPNLFENNLNLGAILLYSNRISHIDANVFNNFVNKLSTLYLSGNICLFEDVYNNKVKANQIIAKVQTGSCKDESKLPATTTLATEIPDSSLTSTQFDELKKLIEELRKEIKDIKGSISNNTQKCGTCAGDNFEARLKFIENAMGENLP